MDVRCLGGFGLIKKLLFALLLCAASSSFAATVLPMVLDEIVDSSAVAFQGICTGNRTERDPLTNLVVTYTTFDVKEVIKGNVQKTHVIKQIGGVMPSGEASYLVHGIPKFAVGEEYVLFLAGVSSAGFSSPIGLSQGKFSIEQGDSGKMVSNGRDMRELTAKMPQADSLAIKEGSRKIGLDDLKRLTRARVENFK